VTNAPTSIPYQGGFAVNVAYFTSQFRQVVAEVQSLSSSSDAYGTGKSKVNGKGTIETTVYLYANLQPEKQYNLVVKLMDQGSQSNTIYDHATYIVTAGNFTQQVGASSATFPLISLIALSIFSVLFG